MHLGHSISQYGNQQKTEPHVRWRTKAGSSSMCSRFCCILQGLQGKLRETGLFSSSGISLVLLNMPSLIQQPRFQWELVLNSFIFFESPELTQYPIQQCVDCQLPASNQFHNMDRDQVFRCSENSAQQIRLFKSELHNEMFPVAIDSSTLLSTWIRSGIGWLKTLHAIIY